MYYKKISLILLSIISLVSLSFSGVDEEMLTRMREEEKMSYDLYSEFYQKWGLDVFLNVSESEYVHKQRIKELLELYKIEDPVLQTQDEQGVFVNKEVQEQYDKYLVNGNISDLSALTAGAELEEQDVYELRKKLKIIKEDYILKILIQLERATQNHLKAFVKKLMECGIDYQPCILSQQDYDEIISSTKYKGTVQK